MKPIITNIENVRIVKYDALNYQVQREEVVISPNRREIKWVDKGFAQTMTGCYQMILKKELLVDVEKVKEVEDYVAEMQRAERRLMELIHDADN